ncbi:alpha/beta fold hydrolase [Nocardioides panacisoli]|uniref:AB hydrolase-1 domain-containing protein n=1 Tax=Nocardioides panacisoli TaxID=627624 RepID=A0ABP7HSG2_9ACTN
MTTTHPRHSESETLMDTHTQTNGLRGDQQDDTAEHDRARASGPVARLVAASLVAGLVAAAVLVLVVFPGAAESTITGSFLVAFGFGWALLGWLTARFTDRSLRWTAVPAVAMAATGAALLAFTPEDAAMRAMGWVWPVATVALAGYIWDQARRTVPRRGRWMLTGVAAVLAVISIGGAYEDVAVVREQPASVAPGTLYDVDGHQMYLDCRGHGSPTVVLFNGLGEVTASWVRIVDQVASHTRVCAYDRAGQGWSESANHLQDGVEVAADLHALLQAAGEHGPYVLTGHSTGGTFALTYAAQYPDQVAGMVLLDSSSPHQFDLPAYPGQYAMMRRGLAVLPTLDRFGLGRLLWAASPARLPDPAAEEVAELSASARAARSGRDEISMLPEVFEQAQALTTLGGRPLAVLTASESQDGTDGWPAAQDQLAALSTNSTHRTVDASHAGLLEDVGPARESADAVTEVVRAARTASATGR